MKYYVELTVRLEYDVYGSLGRDDDEGIINDQLRYLVDRGYADGKFVGTYDMACKLLSHGTMIMDEETRKKSK